MCSATSRLFLALGMAAFCGASAAEAGPLARVRASEAAVKAMPLEQRPNRLGHVYGNNVRRVQQGRLCVNCAKTDTPVRRFFYVTR